MYNYFVTTTEQGNGKALYSTVYRAPVGRCLLSGTAEHYKGAGKWEVSARLDPDTRQLVSTGPGRRFPPDAKLARAFMLFCARQERQDARTRALTALLARAEDFIAGFEDDPDQKGVKRLLREIRKAVGDRA